MSDDDRRSLVTPKTELFATIVNRNDSLQLLPIPTKRSIREVA